MALPDVPGVVFTGDGAATAPERGTRTRSASDGDMFEVVTAASAMAIPGDRFACVTGVFRDIGDLKWLYTADRRGSWARRAFTRAWAGLVAGEDPVRVADRECAAALAATRLGDLDAVLLRRCGLSVDEIHEVSVAAIDEAAAVLHPSTAQRARSCPLSEPAQSWAVPPFVAPLANQPRPGPANFDVSSVQFERGETYAEHCWAVAVYAALLADDFDADPGHAFLLGLVHHLHNAVLPDTGSAARRLLGSRLAEVVSRLTEEQVMVLPPALQAPVRVMLACALV